MRMLYGTTCKTGHMLEVMVTRHTSVMVIVLLIAGMFAGLLGEGCAATSRSTRVDSSAPAYVMSMANELKKQGITTQWTKPTDAGPTRTMSKPYQVFPTTYPATWTVKEIVHPGRGGYYGNVNQTGWVVANDKNDCDWAANTGTVWKQGHDHLDLYRVQNGTMVKVTALDGTQASSAFAYNTSYTLTDHYVIWVTYDTTSALAKGSSSGKWQVVAYDLVAGRQLTVLGMNDAAWGTPVTDALPELCVLSDSTFGLLLMSKDIASGNMFSRLVLLDLGSHKNRVLASSPVGAPWAPWDMPVAAHGSIFVNQYPASGNDTLNAIVSISTADGTVTPLFSSPLRLTSGLGETLCLVRQTTEASDSATGSWSGVTDVWTYDCVRKELICRFRVPGDDVTGGCKSATAFAKGIAYSAFQTILQAYFYSYATKTICYTDEVIGSVFPPGTGLVLNKDQRAYFGDIPDKNVSGNLLVVEPQ